mgnify:CR=1 FL=1
MCIRDRNSSLGNKENDGNVHAHDAMTAEALQWIKDHQNEAFFLYLPYTVPHLGLQVPAHIDDLTDTDGIVFDNTIRTAIDEFYPDRPFGSPIPHPGSSHYAPTGDMRHVFAALISALDRDVGRILDLVTTLELDEDTMILFTSDIGPSFANEVDTAFFQSTGFLRGRKNILLEGGIRVPMIARWPGQIPPGTVAAEREDEFVDHAVCVERFERLQAVLRRSSRRPPATGVAARRGPATAR